MKGELGLSYFFIKMQDLKSLFEGKIKGTIATGCDIDPKYLTDFVGARHGKADVYVQALDEEDVKNTLVIANEHKLPVVVRGAGTNLTGSTIPDGGIVLDVSAMNKILSLDE